ncbi:MAG: hypothetical protein Athens041674_664 [Parcubacteria group bacterium Athens0416_74]|nr:MAG: hypothetical protein Athens041674_664 [Parcubacteria group bacterium Athens0416_74]
MSLTVTKLARSLSAAGHASRAQAPLRRFDSHERRAAPFSRSTNFVDSICGPWGNRTPASAMRMRRFTTELKARERNRIYHSRLSVQLIHQPNGAVEDCCKSYPYGIRHKEPRSRAIDVSRAYDEHHDAPEEEEYFDKGNEESMESEEED